MTRFKTDIQHPVRQVLLIWLLATFISLPMLIFARNVPMYKVVDGKEELQMIKCRVIWNYTDKETCTQMYKHLHKQYSSENISDTVSLDDTFDNCHSTAAGRCNVPRQTVFQRGYMLMIIIIGFIIPLFTTITSYITMLVYVHGVNRGLQHFNSSRQPRQRIRFSFYFSLKNLIYICKSFGKNNNGIRSVYADNLVPNDVAAYYTHF